MNTKQVSQNDTEKVRASENPHMGSLLDDLLEEDGTLEDVRIRAIHRLKRAGVLVLVAIFLSLIHASSCLARVFEESAISHIRACISKDINMEPQGIIEFDTIDRNGEHIDHISMPFGTLLTEPEKIQARSLLATALLRLHQQYGIPTPTATPTPTPTPTRTPVPTATPIATPTSEPDPTPIEMSTPEPTP